MNGRDTAVPVPLPSYQGAAGHITVIIDLAGSLEGNVAIGFD